MVRIYLAEDQVMIAQALQMLLELETDFEVVGIAADGKAALNGILDSKPDVEIGRAHD